MRCWNVAITKKSADGNALSWPAVSSSSMRRSGAMTAGIERRNWLRINARPSPGTMARMYRVRDIFMLVQQNPAAGKPGDQKKGAHSGRPSDFGFADVIRSARAAGCFSSCRRRPYSSSFWRRPRCGTARCGRGPRSASRTPTSRR